ncbi:MAG: hypothetical protein FWG52_09885 [Proteobacteria bacterium]|nr:hypothetical protein [Pseudomonadota bacterium]
MGLVRPGEIFVQVPQKPEALKKPEKPASVQSGQGGAE